MNRPLNQRSTSRLSSLYFPCLLVLICLFTGTQANGDDAEKLPAQKAGEADPRPLQEFIQDLFGRKKNGPRPFDPRRTPQREPSNDAEVGGSRDPIDNRAPRDNKVEQLLSAADIAVRQKNWKSAVDLYQRLLDQPEDSLHRMANGEWQSVRQAVNEKFGQLPEATLVEYRSQYGGLASQQLAAARRSGMAADYVGVATRFFHTPAGYEAANYLAAQHFDRSEFELAARWYAEIAKSPAAIARQDSWLMQAALAIAKSGDPNGANLLLEKLSQGTKTTVPLGTGAVNASEWLSQAQGETASGVSALVDWTQVYGNAARNGTAVGGAPLLSPNWELPLTGSHTVRNSLKWLLHDLQDQQRALILAAQPLVVDGKVIYRDLHGLRSVDIERGRTLWEGVEGVSPERILGGFPSQQIDPQEAWRFQMNPFQNAGEYQGMSAEFSPLTSLLFRDGTYGLISSDGKQVFVIEDHGILSSKQPGQHWGWDGNADPHDPFGVPWKTNRLVSYDLKTGRALWSLGGNESRESFDLPLAGSYFYGTPAVDGNDLFLVAGKGDDIRLWSLDRKTGNPQWSQLIAYSDTKIDLDIARRWITSQVAVGNGVIVCPTTVGWLVAIDRMRQSVLWAHRYSPRTSTNGADRETGSPLLAQRELNGSWCPSAPVISGSHVVFTPQDEPLLICLNAVDGRRVWEKPKERGLYLAGVFNQLVVIVGETGVTALRLADGSVAWTANFEEGIHPSGRSVVVDEQIYVPLSTGELQTIGLATGEVLSRTYVGLRQPSLGNLAMHHGKLVSLSPMGLTVFGQRDSILAEIQQRLATDPADAWALLRSSEIQLLNHNYADALQLLRRISVERLMPTERDRMHTALVECLSTLIHQDILHRGSELDELGHLLASPSDELLYQQLIAEKLLVENKPVEAFDVFVRLAEGSGETLVTHPDDRHVKTRRINWFSGRISEIWTAAPETERRLIDKKIADLIADAADRDRDSCQRIADLFSFHAISVKARQRLVEWMVESKDLSGARLELEQLAESSDRTVVAAATERLARLMLDSKLPDDAVYYYRQLETKFTDVIVREGMTGAAMVSAIRNDKSLDFEPRQYGMAWKKSPLRLEQSVMNYSQPSQDVFHETPLPYFSRFGLEFYQNEQRLALESVATGQVEWMIPLRGALRVNDDGYLAASHIGHQMFFVNRGILHAVSPIEKRVLWTKSFEGHADGSIQLKHESRPLVAAMTSPGREDSPPSLLLQRALTTGNLAVVQPRYLCLYGRRSLSLVDPRTGEERWRREGLPLNAQVVGSRDVVFAIIPGKNDALAFRTSDGKSLEVPGIAKLLNNALVSHGPSFLLFEQAGADPLKVFGIRRSKTTKSVLRLYDPVAKFTNWQLELPAGTLVSLLGQNEVIAAHADGLIQRIDVASGAMIPLEAIPSQLASTKKGLPTQDKYVMADDDRIYLIVNNVDHRNQSYGESLASIRVNGTIFAWNRQDNRFLWSQSIEHQNLVVDRFSAMPVLLFVSRSWRPRPRMEIGSLNIAAIHKQSGQMLVDTKIPSVYSGFHALTVSSEAPSIELKSYNARLRLVPADDPVAPGNNPLPPDQEKE